MISQQDQMHGTSQQGNWWILAINLLIDLIDLWQTYKQKRANGGWKNIETWGMGLSIEEVPKQFVVEGGAKFEREPKTHLHTILFIQNH